PRRSNEETMADRDRHEVLGPRFRPLVALEHAHAHAARELDAVLHDGTADAFGEPLAVPRVLEERAHQRLIGCAILRDDAERPEVAKEFRQWPGRIARAGDGES